MKRIHVEFMVATIMLAWVISNMVLMKPTDDISGFFAVFFPILFGTVIQYMVLIAEAATER